jgi:hypothetical protein
VVASCGTAAMGLAGLLKHLLTAIAIYDEKIEALARAHPDYELMN